MAGRDNRALKDLCLCSVSLDSHLDGWKLSTPFRYANNRHTAHSNSCPLHLTLWLHLSELNAITIIGTSTYRFSNRLLSLGCLGTIVVCCIGQPLHVQGHAQSQPRPLWHAASVIPWAPDDAPCHAVCADRYICGCNAMDVCTTAYITIRP